MVDQPGTSEVLSPQTPRPEEKRGLLLDIGILDPIGAEYLRPQPGVMKNPIFDPRAARAAAAALAITGIAALSRSQQSGASPQTEDARNTTTIQGLLTRRKFLKGAGATFLGLSSVSLIPRVQHKVAELFHHLDMRLYTLLTNSRLIQNYWLREKRGEAIYQ